MNNLYIPLTDVHKIKKQKQTNKTKAKTKQNKSLFLTKHG